MELLLQGFVILWLSIGSIILLLMYFNQATSKKKYFFLSSLFVVLIISYSIYRENIISFRPIVGYPTEKVRFIAYNIALEEKKKVINLWVFNTNTKLNALHTFDYNIDIEKTLREANQRQKGGSSTILSMVKTPALPGIPSGAAMVGEVEKNNSLPLKLNN